MKTVAELEEAFGVYFREMDACRRAKCHWALLHLAVVMPDICGALQYGSHARVGRRYLAWCDANFPQDPMLTKEDRYAIRCAILHEGSTLPDGGKSQYSTVAFAGQQMGKSKMSVNDPVRGLTLLISVVQFAKDTQAAVRGWFAALQNDAAANRVVERNIERLAQVQPRRVPLLVAVPVGPKTRVRQLLGMTTVIFNTTASGR